MWECKCGHKNKDSAKYCIHCGEKRGKQKKPGIIVYEVIYGLGLTMAVVAIIAGLGLTLAHEYAKFNAPTDYLPTSIARHSAPPTPQPTPTPTPEATPTPTPTPTPKPTAKPTPKPTPKPTATPKPSGAQYPQTSSYYANEKVGYINAPGGYAVYGFAYPKKMSENVIIMEPLHGEAITACAEENGFAFVQINSSGKCCWVNADYISSSPPTKSANNLGTYESANSSTSAGNSYTDYMGSWYKDGNSENYFIYVNAQNGSSISFSIEAIRRGANGSPAQYATAEINNLDISGGRADFYFTDSFGNTGNGTVYASTEEILLSLNTTYIPPPGNNWGIQTAAGSYYRYG